MLDAAFPQRPSRHGAGTGCLIFNVVAEKYFESDRHISRAPAVAQRAGRISPYDELAMEYAGRYAFDWRLIVSQMYQESRFDPEARSFADAAGLLLALPLE